jgi:uncharacterized protein (DUF2249 family)
MFLFDMKNTKTEAKSTKQSSHGHGCCGSHGDLSADAAATDQQLVEGVLDVRTLIPARRHSLIFETFNGLRPGGSFMLVNDHDPKPLYYQFAYEAPGTFTWNYEEQGPAVWRVRIGKATQGVLQK